MRYPLALASLILLAACNPDGGGRARPNGDTGDNTPAIETVSAIRSQLTRAPGTPILTTAQEAQDAANLPSGYEAIPSVSLSDDGLGPTTHVHTVIHGALTCGSGTAFTSIQARIADCAAKNSALLASWTGQASGTGGEGDWKLVTKNAAGEVWLDGTTNYLWSDRISDAANWCNASGNNETPVSGTTIDCKTLGGQNLCANVLTTGISDNEVSWRLPTRNDFLQADLNGARFVLPNVDEVAFWTATVSGANRDEAWMMSMSAGILSAQNRSSTHGVRCVGRRI